MWNLKLNPSWTSASQKCPVSCRGKVPLQFFLNTVYLFQATEEDASSDEDLDDEAMMELDKSLAAVFSEQQKRSQAKKDEKTKIRKEKTLVRDFKIKVVLFVSAHVWFWLEADSQALLTWVCGEGAGPGGGVCGQAGWQSSGLKLSGASPQRHRERDELRQPPTGAGLPPPGCRYLQVTASF